MNDTLCGDCLSTMKAWADGCADMCVTSPPYWGLRSYSWGGDFSLPHKKHSKDGKPLHDWHDLDEVYQGCSDCPALRPCYGIEPTLDEYLAKTVEIFREVTRVLKDWGTLWLNVGDAYIGSNNKSKSDNAKMVQKFSSHGSEDKQNIQVDGFENGQCLMLPERIALALQADNWILRSKIIWCKAWSFHDCKGRHITEAGTDLFGDAYENVILDEPDYVGSCMPESLGGWAWKRHKVKAGGKGHKSGGLATGKNAFPSMNKIDLAQWSDCPGCPKCEPNGGLVLRQGSWRPTNSWEYMYLFSKSRKYYCDGEAVKENAVSQGIAFAEDLRGESWHNHQNDAEQGNRSKSRAVPISGRNLRSVWCINPQPLKLQHYASYPEALVEPCIKAGTSQVGNCSKCGRPYARIIDSKQIKRERPADKTSRHKQGNGVNSCGNTVAGVENTTLGWKSTCQCHNDCGIMDANLKGLQNATQKQGSPERLLAQMEEGQICQQSTLPRLRETTKINTKNNLQALSKDCSRQSKPDILQSDLYDKVDVGTKTGKSLSANKKSPRQISNDIKASLAADGNSQNRSGVCTPNSNGKPSKSSIATKRKGASLERGQIGQSTRKSCAYDNTITCTMPHAAPEGCRLKPVPAVVLDPFMGSSTSALVAERLGRNWLGCEVNPEYVTIGNKRLADARGGLM